MIKDTVRGGDVVVTGILTDNDKRHCERRGCSGHRNING